MDTLTQLAIMAKAVSVFGNERTFLSFPVTPLAFAPEDLDLFSAPESTGAQVARTVDRLAAFSELVNRVPTGAAWEPDAAGHLWDAYAEIIAGEYASSSRTAQEEDAYRRACATLFVTDPVGTRRPTAEVQAYRAFRDNHRVLDDEHRSLLLSLQAAGANADVAHLQARERDLAARVADALAAWEQQGFKSEVEHAEAEVRRLGSRSPMLSWQEWRTRFDPDTAALTRPGDLLQIYPTGFAPDNALAEGSWRPMEITGPELTQAAADAPADLRARLGADSPAELSAVSFEFSCATLVRPWLAAEAFEARFWRLRDGGLLSDGGTPARGSCPAYTVAVVFARRVTEHRHRPDPVPPSPPFSFDATTITAVPQRRPVLRLLVGTRLPVPAGRLRPVATTPDLADGVRLRRSTTGLEAAGRAAPVLGQAAPAILRLSSFRRLQQAGPTVPDPAPEGSAQPPPDDTIHVCAFLCRPLPRCPDPDPALAW